jgi:hypothetical protein
MHDLGQSQRIHHDDRRQGVGPDPVRRVMIPKANGGERPRGIPTIRDRVIQTAAKIVTEPIFGYGTSFSGGYRQAGVMSGSFSRGRSLVICQSCSHQVRTRDKSEDRQDAGSHRAFLSPGARRRGD